MRFCNSPSAPGLGAPHFGGSPGLPCFSAQLKYFNLSAETSAYHRSDVLLCVPEMTHVAGRCRAGVPHLDRRRRVPGAPGGQNPARRCGARRAARARLGLFRGFRQGCVAVVRGKSLCICQSASEEWQASRRRQTKWPSSSVLAHHCAVWTSTASTYITKACTRVSFGARRSSEAMRRNDGLTDAVVVCSHLWFQLAFRVCAAVASLDGHSHRRHSGTLERPTIVMQLCEQRHTAHVATQNTAALSLMTARVSDPLSSTAVQRI